MLVGSHSAKKGDAALSQWPRDETSDQLNPAVEVRQRIPPVGIPDPRERKRLRSAEMPLRRAVAQI
jgi:hypothetical protein